MTECLICTRSDTFAEVLCKNKHAYCSECINNYYETNIFNDTQITKSCFLCKEEFFNSKLELMLNDDVKTILFKRDILGSFEFPDNYVLMNCPQCTKGKEGAFLIDINDYQQYYNCEKCSKQSCLYCREAAIIKNHKKCNELLKICESLENVIARSISFKCGKCKVKQIKDFLVPQLKSGCTHITCNQCNMYTCYVCGGHQEDIDQKHNDDWAINNKRCPLYLRKFNEKINSFPGDENFADTFFKTYKTRTYLKQVINKYGIKKVKEAIEIFKNKRLAHLYNRDDLFESFTSIPLIDEKLNMFFKP